MNRPPAHTCALLLWRRDPRGNVLKHFMGWIKTQAPRSRFSYAHQGTTLLRNLSLLDNLLMAFEEGELSGTYHERERTLALKLEAQNLKGLASWFQNPRRSYAELTPQERFVASVCHALLRPAERTLIDFEGVTLDPLCLRQLQQVLREKASERLIVVHAHAPEDWQELACAEFSPTPAVPERKQSA